MKLSAPLALVDGRRQLVVMDGDGTDPRSTADSKLWADWAHSSPDDLHSWPSWSPDGSHLAAFRIPRDGMGCRVWVDEIDGVHGAEFAPLDGRLPIYLQWSHDGQRLAILSQDGSRLVLEVADPRHSDHVRRWLTGSPLFFTWLPQRKIAAFVGQEKQPSLTILDEHGNREDLPGIPGNFCAPVNVPDQLAWVAHNDGEVSVVLSDLGSGSTRSVEKVDGLVALLPSPDGRSLARAIAPDGTGVSYHDLSIIDIATGEAHALTHLSCQAFFWLPTGEGLVIAQQRRKRGTVVWLRVGLDGSTERLAELHPSRDLKFYLRFFEQYCMSHPIVDPTGKTLLLAGALHGAADPDGPPRIWAVPLDGDTPEDLGEGMFGTFGPRAPK